MILFSSTNINNHIRKISHLMISLFILEWKETFKSHEWENRGIEKTRYSGTYVSVDHSIATYKIEKESDGRERLEWNFPRDWNSC